MNTKTQAPKEKESIGKTEMVRIVAERAHVQIQQAQNVINSLLEVIKSNILDGNKISLKGFGVFGIVSTKERNGINPQTKQAILIPPSKKITFTPAKPFKELVKSATSSR